VWWRGLIALQKKIIFRPQNNKFGCILMQLLTLLGHGFCGSIAKRSVQKQCKNYQKIRGQTRGGAARSNNPLNTPLHTTAANHGAEIAGRTKLTNAMLNVAWLVSLVGRTEAVSLSIITFRDARSLWDCQKRRVYRV